MAIKWSVFVTLRESTEDGRVLIHDLGNAIFDCPAKAAAFSKAAIEGRLPIMPFSGITTSIHSYEENDGND